MATQEELEFIARFRVEALAAARQAEEALRDWADAADDTGEAFDDAGKLVEASAGRMMKEFAKVGAAAAVVYKTITSSLSSFGDLDRALIGVAKTSNMADADVQKLGLSLRGLAIEKGIDINEYLEVAAIAGQLGVSGAKNIEAFTKTVVDLGNASNLVGEEGAQTLARMLTVSGEGVQHADRLASVIVRLGNNVAASEREIAAAGQEIMLATAPFGVGTTRATAFGAAMAEMGLRAELSGTSVGRIFVEMSTAASAGGDALLNFAKATGTTREEFLQIQQQDPTQLFIKLLQNMNKLSSTDVVKTLTDLKVMNSESAKSLLPLIANVDRLTEVLKMADNEASAPSALAEEAARAEEAFSRMYVRVTQAWGQIMSDLGAALAPVATLIAEFILKALDLFKSLPDVVQKSILIFGALATLLGSLAVALAGLSVIFGTVSLSAIAMAAALTAATVAGTALGVVLNVLLSPIGLLTVAVGLLYAAWKWFFAKDVTRSVEEITATFEESSAKITDLNNAIIADNKSLVSAKQALIDAYKQEGNAGRIAAEKEVNNLNTRIAKNKELMEMEKLRRASDLTEARRAAAEAEQIAMKQAKQAAIASFMDSRPDKFSDQYATGRVIEDELVRRGATTAESRLNVLQQIVTERLREINAAGKSISDSVMFSQAFEEYEAASTDLGRTQAAVASLELQLKTLGKVSGDTARAISGGIALSVLRIVPAAEVAGRSLEELVKAYANREGELKKLQMDRATAMDAVSRAMLDGNAEAVASFRLIVDGIDAQIDKTTDAEGRINALREKMAELNKEIHSGDSFIGQSVAEKAMSSLNTQLIDAVKNIKNLNDADLTKLENSLKGVGDTVSTFRSGIAGWFSNLIGFEGMPQPQFQKGGNYGPSRLSGSEQRTADVMEAVRATIIKFEGYLDKGKWDVNHNRAGYGSDTITLSDGSHKKITAGMAVTAADAERDLARRMNLYMKEQASVIGSAWRGMSDKQVAAIASIQHNYGSIPKRITEALQSGNNDAIAAAIARMAMDYTKDERKPGAAQDQGKKPINYDRRMDEASAFGDTTAYARQADVVMDAATETYRKAKKAADEAAQKAKDQAKAISNLSEEKLRELKIDEFKQQVMGLDAIARDAAIKRYEYELELKAKGVAMDDKIIGSSLTYAQQYDQLQQTAKATVSIMPSIRDAIAAHIEGIGNAASVGESVISSFTGAFDQAIDGILAGGGLDSMREAFGNAFRSMGAELIKFSLQILILKPILAGLQKQLDATSAGGAAGGGGFLSGLGKLVSGFFGFGGGTATGKSAKGNVIKGGQTVPMMMMGESDAEAILPLARGKGGELGVKVVGGSAPGASGDNGAYRAVYDSAVVLLQAANKLSGDQSIAQTMTARNVGLEPAGGARGGAATPSVVYSPTINIDAGGNQSGQGMDDRTAQGFGAALDAHMRNAIAEFIVDQQRSGGMLNPTAKPYGV